MVVTKLLYWEMSNQIGRYTRMCAHTPACPSANDRDCWTAHVVADHSEQGWCRLCNGVILFDDGYYLAPDGHSEPVLLTA
jgi:Family of unknown function (DUF5999)